MTALLVALAVAAMVAAGDLVATTLRPTLAANRAGRFGCALLIGPCVIAYVLFLANLAGVPIAPTSCRMLGAATIACWIFRRSWRLATPADDPHRPASPRWFSVLLWVLLLAPVVLGAAFALATPPVKDALVNWSLKVAVLFEDRTVRTPDFRAEQRYLFHPNYPLLVPLAQVFLCGVAGAVTDHASKLVFSCAHLGVGLLALAALAPRLGRQLALLFAALVASVPHFYMTDVQYRFAGSVQSGYADPLFAALAAAVCMAAIRWLETRERRDAVLVGLLLGFALFSKNEGLPLAAAIAAGVALAVGVERLRGVKLPRWPDLIPAALVLLAVTLPWFAFRNELPARDENYQELLHPEALAQKLWRLPVILTSTLTEAMSVDHHAFTWPLVAIALVGALASPAGRRRLGSGGSLVLLVVIVGMATVYAAVFVVTPLPVVDSLVTSIPRTFFQLDLVALLLAANLMPTGKNAG